MRKILALVLALCMMTGVVSAVAEGFTPAESYDVGERAFNGGSITTVAAQAGGGEVDVVRYAGEEGKDKDGGQDSPASASRSRRRGSERTKSSTRPTPST